MTSLLEQRATPFRRYVVPAVAESLYMRARPWPRPDEIARDRSPRYKGLVRDLSMSYLESVHEAIPCAKRFPERFTVDVARRVITDTCRACDQEVSVEEQTPLSLHSDNPYPYIFRLLQDLESQRAHYREWTYFPDAGVLFEMRRCLYDCILFEGCEVAFLPPDREADSIELTRRAADRFLWHVSRIVEAKIVKKDIVSS